MALVKALVIGMGVLIAAGFVVIVVTLVQRSGAPAGPPVTDTATLQLGERLESASIDGSRVLLHIVTADGGARLEVRDLKEGALIGTVIVEGAP
jgi:hypothetical protein